MASSAVALETSALELTDLEVSFGAVKAITGITVGFGDRVITGLVGPNGAGKTTLLNAITGFAPISRGRILVGGAEVQDLSPRARVQLGIARTFQTVRLMEQETVLENIRVGCERWDRAGFFSDALGIGRGRSARRSIQQASAEVIDLLSLQSWTRATVSELPYGIRRLVEIGRVLVGRPTVLLLDEPMAGMDAAGRASFAETLLKLQEESPRTVLLIEHDVGMIRQLCPYTVAMDYGYVIKVGSTGEVLDSDEVRRAYFGDNK